MVKPSKANQEMPKKYTTTQTHTYNARRYQFITTKQSQLALVLKYSATLRTRDN